MVSKQGEIEEPGNQGLFKYHPLLKNHSNQERDNAIHQFSFPESIEELVELINHSVLV